MKILVFTGGEAPEPERARIFLQNFLGTQKKPDYVLAADSGLETLRAWQAHYKDEYNFSPSLILGDFDSIKDKKILDSYDQSLVERSPSYKDDTDTELALKRAEDLSRGLELAETRGLPRIICAPRSKGAFVTLIGGAGGRTDHFLSIYNLFGTKNAPDAWLCGEQVLWKAEKTLFEISGLKAGDVISIARAFGKNRGGKIRSQGLEWENDLFRKNGMPSVSKTIKEKCARLGKPAQIDFLRGSFVLIAPLFASVRLGKCNTKK